MTAQIIPFPKHAPIVPPASQETEPDGWVDLNEQLLGNLARPCVVNVEGADENTGCAEGDRLIVDCSLPPRAGDLVIFDEDGRGLLRRYASVPLKLATGAPEESSRASVFGVVVHRIHTLRRIEQPKRKGGRR